MELAAAVSAATLTTTRKLSRNFSYYGSKNPNEVRYSRKSLLNVCNTLRMDLFGLQNLFLDHPETATPFMVTLAGDIYDSFENLHRNLLFHDAYRIESIIPKIDLERSYWDNFTNHQFYNEGISEYIDQSTLPLVSQIKDELSTFPERPDTSL